ncbi:MAG: CPBP family intramembrane metalloprotease [Deltaproteobacteria bacterium]|nr:CPBP family intramembrane metalloprotease [Deltaproteobacteria bacterium]
MIVRLYRRLVSDQFAAIDAMQGQDPGTRRSPTFKTVMAAVSVAVLLTLMNFYVLDGRFQTSVSSLVTDLFSRVSDETLRYRLLEFSPLYRHVIWSLGCFTLYFVIPAIVVIAVYREPLKNYGISTRGFFRHLPIYLTLFVPVFGAVVVVSFTHAFQHTYPFYHNPQGLLDLAIWEFFYCLQFFALEFFFRGFMIHSMKHRMGSMAVFAMAVPYCMIHFQKPMAEALAAILAGTVLGVLSLRTNTIWGGVFIHSAVAISMDWSSLIQRGWTPFH